MHITALTLNFILFSNILQFLGQFSSYPDIKVPISPFIDKIIYVVGVHLLSENTRTHLVYILF